MDKSPIPFSKVEIRTGIASSRTAVGTSLRQRFYSQTGTSEVPPPVIAGRRNDYEAISKDRIGLKPHEAKNLSIEWAKATFQFKNRDQSF
ncbi:hypothetical protein DDT91_14845 [Algoriphagus sp. AK58]|nr:hypothetical protein [Algoriphagus sp. AK58]